MLTLTPEQIYNALRERTVTIKFEKADGSLREMLATLNPDITSQFDEYTWEEVVDHNKKTVEYLRTTEDPVIRVFDIEKDGWRSFKFSRLLSVE